MAELHTIARPYAQAAFALAREGNALPSWGAALQLAVAVVTDVKVAATLDNPRLTADDKAALVLSICGDKLGAEQRNFLRVLIDADRVALLPQIRTQFLESAFPMTDGQLAELAGVLEKRFGRRIETTVVVDPALIGGARITVGDTVVDGTVQAQLQAMARDLRA